MHNISYSQENQTNSNSNSTSLEFHQRNIPQFLNETYTNPSVGFHILLPGGWQGINYQNIAIISPAGVHLSNGNLGPNGDKVLMVIEVLNVSDFLDQRKAYGEIQKGDCRVLSDKYVTINELDGQELFLQCGANNDNKIVNYFFASGNKVIVIGFKGSDTVFDSNLDKFRNSVGTLSIDKPSDIKKIR
ncbi:MAG: hypothetical protein E6K97_08015 [Thaumarchaeota archaeon]|nr:MAG: hypothetical protein E6K97_08015 [Nitrososphaerota archaeon]